MSAATNLDIEWIDATAFDRMPGPTPSRGGRRALIVLLALVMSVIVAAVVGGYTEQLIGVQPSPPQVRTSAAETQQWELLESIDGSTRAGWPRPMIARGDDECFGFENDNVLTSNRPTLARCTAPGEVPALEPHSIVSLMTIMSGLDTWHVLQTGKPLASIRLTTLSGDEIPADRIYIEDDIVALRLPLAEQITDMTWKMGRIEVSCAPPEDATTTGRFCPTG